MLTLYYHSVTIDNYNNSSRYLHSLTATEQSKRAEAIAQLKRKLPPVGVNFNVYGQGASPAKRYTPNKPRQNIVPKPPTVPTTARRMSVPAREAPKTPQTPRGSVAADAPKTPQTPQNVAKGRMSLGARVTAATGGKTPNKVLSPVREAINKTPEKVLSPVDTNKARTYTVLDTKSAKADKSQTSDKSDIGNPTPAKRMKLLFGITPSKENPITPSKMAVPTPQKRSLLKRMLAAATPAHSERPRSLSASSAAKNITMTSYTDPQECINALVKAITDKGYKCKQKG